jgi:hypothetical protein
VLAMGDPQSRGCLLYQSMSDARLLPVDARQPRPRCGRGSVVGKEDCSRATGVGYSRAADDLRAAMRPTLPRSQRIEFDTPRPVPNWYIYGSSRRSACPLEGSGRSKGRNEGHSQVDDD